MVYNAFRYLFEQYRKLCLPDAAKDYLVDLLACRIYDEGCGISYEEFKHALFRMSETTIMLSKFNKEAAVAYLVKETGLTVEECSEAYDYYLSTNI